MPELDAYAEDCRLSGLAELGDGRLTDYLNATDELDLEAVRLESLEDGRLVEAGDVGVATDELCAVVAVGPRGDPARRLRTMTTRVEVRLGPYRVVGMVHGTPASDPLAAALRRATWLPLTEATVTYHRAGDEITDEIETLIVNRSLATLFRAIEDEVATLPWEESRPEKVERSRGVDLTAWTGYEDFPPPR